MAAGIPTPPVVDQQTKTFFFVNAQNEREYKTTITQKTTVAEALEQHHLSVNDVNVVSSDNRAMLQPTDILWKFVDDGGKLHIIGRSIVGTGGAATRPLVGIFRRLFDPQHFPWGTSQTTSHTYKRDMGWTQRKTGSATTRIYDGFYRIPSGKRWKGVTEAPLLGSTPKFWIFEPPIDELRKTQWGGCFHPTGDGWYFIGWVPGSEPKNVDTGIATVIHVLRTVMPKVA